MGIINITNSKKVTLLNIQKVKDIKFQMMKNRKSLKQIFDFFLLNSINLKKNLKYWILISDTSAASILITSVQSKLKKQSYTHHPSFCLQYPVFYLSLPFCLLSALSITFLPLSALLSFLSSRLMHCVKLSSSAFRASIFLHLPFPLRDPFCPLISSSLLYLHFDPFLSSVSCSALPVSLRWSVQQGRVTFLGCLLHMVHIPAGLPRGPLLLTAGAAETSPMLSVIQHCLSLK